MSSGSSSVGKAKKRKSPKGKRKDLLTSMEIEFLVTRIRDSFDQIMIELGLEHHEIDNVKDDYNNISKKWKPEVLKLAMKKMGKNPDILVLLKSALIKYNNTVVWDEFKEEFNVECDDKRNDSSEVLEPTIGPNNCVVAGVRNQFKSSSLVPVHGPVQSCKKKIRLGVIAKSSIIQYDEAEEDVRISCLLHDGQTIWNVVAFGDSAKKWHTILQEEIEYELKDYSIKRTNERYERTDFQIILHQNTVCKPFQENKLTAPVERKYRLADLKEEKFEKLLISTDTVIICEIGDIFQPKQRFLREMYVMDRAGTIMKVNFWFDHNEDFKFSFKDTVELKFFKIDQFDGEYYLEFTDVSKAVKCTADKQSFEPFLLRQNLRRLQAKDMSLEEIKDLEEGRHNVIVNEAVIKRFKHDDGSLIYKQGGVVINHGKLEPLSGDKFYCKRCKKSYNFGIDVVQLVASVDDGSSQAWVMMYTQTAEVILGDCYDVFKEESTKRSERSAIFDKIKKRKRKYKFGLKVICSVDESDNKVQRIIVRNVSKILH